MTKSFFRSMGALCLFVSLILIIAVLFAVYAYAGDTSGEKKELNIDLIPPEVYEYTSIYSMFEYQYAVKYNTAKEGTFSVESSQSRYKNKMSGTISVRNLDYLSKYDEIYEAWLIDIDSGYKLSLGLFTVDSDGENRFSWSHPSYINEYDIIVITKEEYPDDNPWPNGEVVLVGYFDTTSLTKSSVSYGSGSSLGQYAKYGNLADSVYS